MTHTGTERTRRFYDETGWSVTDGRAVDLQLFGVREDGPIRRELHAAHIVRARRALGMSHGRLSLLECGCGGSPARHLLPGCRDYTGVDFSARGIEMARQAFADVAQPHRFEVADTCALPFDDASFDAVYSAHMIYHIDDPQAQAQALAEMMRVLKPGGSLALLTANPRPLLFPVRLLRRLVADAPLLGGLADRLRKAPPLPFRPMPIGWTLARLRRWGTTTCETAGLPSTAFNQRVSEERGLGRQAWRAVRALDLGAPGLAAWLGNYVLIGCRRS